MLKENQFERFKGHGSQIACHYFISSFFSREIYIFFQGYLLLFTKFLFLFSLAKLKQGWDKTA